MDDYISRQAALDAIDCDITITGRQNAELVASTIGAFVDRVKALPSADVVQVVHGRWENYSPVTIKCSQCGHVIHDWRYSECKYCPNCGAKMDARREE